MHPVLFRISDTIVYSYGVLLALSIAAAFLLARSLTMRDRVPEHVISSSFFTSLFGAMMGARFFAVLLDPSIEFGELFHLKRGGMNLIGGLFGGFLVFWLMCRRANVRFFAAADLVAPGVALASGLARIGCYLFGCDFGVPLSENAPSWLKYVGTFPRWPEGTIAGGSGSPAWVEHVKERGLSITSSHSLPVHPTQLYELLLGLSIAAVLLVGLRRAAGNTGPKESEAGAPEVPEKPRVRGLVFLEFVFLMSSARFFIEVLRDDHDRGSGPFSIPSPIIVPLGAAALGVGGAYAFLSDVPARWRRISYGLAVLGGVLLFFAMRQEGSFSTMSVWTLPQMITLTAGLGAVVAARSLSASAQLDPQGVLAIYRPGFEPKNEAPRNKRKKRKPAA